MRANDGAMKRVEAGMNRRAFGLSLAFGFASVCVTTVARAGAATAPASIAPAAERLAATIDALDVEAHWPAGVHVDWETGLPDGKPSRGPGKHTHCSAFVASAAKRIGIYILRPPEHSPVLLANAQFEWLEKEGAQRGWQPLHDATEAQAAANRGMFVVVSYRNHREDKPGHIAIVRPSDKSADLVRDEGPQITQAGGTNFKSTTTKRGFQGHPRAFERQELKYWAHPVSADALK